jgi:nucleotide sugar dehydrogenase
MPEKTTPSQRQHRYSPLKTSEPTRPQPAAITNVAVVGLGYVGLPLALLARARGYQVVGIDSSSRKRAEIKTASVADLEENFLLSLRRQPLDVAGAFGPIAAADAVIVCVPTPVDENHEPDLGPVKEACSSVARHMHKGQLILLESTVHPGTSEEILIPLMERISKLTAGVDFGFAHCPERINPGDREWTIEKIPRVIGAITPEARTKAAEFYRSLLRASVHEMQTLREAEAVKMVENSFRDINIAFANELAMSFEKLGIDVVNVLRGASTKPFGFMLHLPGCGVGGHCIPVDPYYLIRYAQQNGFTHKFLSLAREINNGMPEFTVNILKDELSKLGEKLEGTKVALLGLSYKANISDLRESPALKIAQLLIDEGVYLKTFDPFIKERSTAATLSEALKDVKAVVVATAHDAFKSLSPIALKELGIAVVVDGRNCLDKEEFLDGGLRYRGIGR